MNFFEKVYGDQLHKFQTLFFISRIRERFFGLRPQNDREGGIRKRFFGLWSQNDTFSLSF